MAKAPNKRPAVVLLSGGLDSATTAALARSQGFAVYLISFAYGQRHAFELTAARRIARYLRQAPPVVVPIDLRVFGGSALTSDLAVPKGRSVSEMKDIPATYVPARNTIFLSLALAYAEVIGSVDIFIGVNALDYSGYPDCRPEYIKAFAALARLATKAAVTGRRPMKIHAPLISLTKAEIIKLGTKLGLDYSLTLSCYDPTKRGAACGQCDACQLRRQGFKSAGLADPTRYSAP